MSSGLPAPCECLLLSDISGVCVEACTSSAAWPLSKILTASVKYRRDGSTVLHTAAKHGHTDVIDVLLQDPAACALLEAEDVDTSTPLLLAVKEGRVDAVRLLLHNGAAVTSGTAHRPCATVLASYRDDQQVLEALLEAHPSSVDMALPNGDTQIPALFLFFQLMVFRSPPGYLFASRSCVRLLVPTLCLMRGWCM